MLRRCILLFCVLFLAGTANAATGKIVGWTTMIERYHMGNGRADEFKKLYLLRTSDFTYEFLSGDRFSVGQQVDFEVNDDDLTIVRPDGKAKKYRLWSELPNEQLPKQQHQ